METMNYRDYRIDVLPNGIARVYLERDKRFATAVVSNIVAISNLFEDVDLDIAARGLLN